ncbi:alpha/beta hydrolase family protein [Qipengyuania nanhaisediminis]|uniref:S9 family peptidase n=1 Tax=Qipengyuania nanhaisediminis TaxID=604088 RepID=UPI0038B28DF3
MKINIYSARLALGMALAAPACAALVHSPAIAQEQAGEASMRQTAERFGVRASVLDISLSPSGTRIAWIAPGPGHTEVLKIFDLEGDGSIASIASNSEIIGDLDHCEWASDTRLVCEIFGMSQTGGGTLLPFTRMFAIGHDGKDPLSMTQSQSLRARGFNQEGGEIVALDIPGEEGEILLTRNYIEENSIGTRLANTKTGLGVDRFDVENGRRRAVEQPDDEASYYLADDQGNIRFKLRRLTDGRGLLTGETVHMVRPAGGSGWDRLGTVTLDGRTVENFTPAAFDAGRDALIAYTSIDGYRSVIAIPIDGSGEARVLASRDDADVAGLVRIGRQRRVVGVSYATEKRSVEYFDEELASLARGLRQALPNQPLINFSGASADESRLLIVASSDTDPGTVYLYDKATRSLEVLLAMRDALVDVPMATMQPVNYPAADGTMIPGYLTLPSGSEPRDLPAIVLPHGGPAARDYWGFDWIVQFLAARGYAVLQPNFRGSAGYGEAWLGRNGYQAWELAIGDVNDAGRWLVDQGIADPGKLAIMGWSYGGYAALQSQVVDPDLYRAVVAIAPVTDLEYLRADARRYTNFRLRDEQLGDGPHIAAGSPRRHADRFAAPVALFHGDLDLNVDVRHSRAMADALEDLGKSVTYTEFDDLQHDLGDSKVRSDMLEAIDAFVQSAFVG